MNQLRLEVDKAMRHLAVDIQATDTYEEIETVREILVNEKFKNKRPTLHDTFDQSKKVIHEIENHTEKNWVGLAAEYKKLITTIRIRDYMMQPAYRLKNEWLYILLFIVFSPVFLAGSISNILPFKLPVNMSNRLVRDPVFRSSIMFGIALVLFPLYYLVIFLTVMYFFSWKWGLLVIALAMLSGLISLFYIRKWKKHRAWRRLNRLKKSGNAAFKRAAEIRENITGIFRHAL
jgi:glycerol-3-phosphate O-acyltransferase / dihydroxyacetone phosphate acyltransferase